MTPKLEDVAKLAKVSKTTVSRVLNKRGYLSQKTIDRVYAAMRELNYHPNVVARQLYKSQTNLIGLLFPTVANPFFGELVDALEKNLYRQGFKVLIGNSMNDPKKEAAYLDQLLIKQVDGLIVGTHNQGIKEYDTANLPIVAIDRIMNADIPIVESDNYRGGELATERLIQRGAKHIIHTNGPIDLETPARRRRVAYEGTMQAHNLEPLTYTVDFNISAKAKKEIFEKIFQEHPEVEAVFAANDVDAALIMNVAQKLGRQVPKDFLVIGYDGTQVVRELMPNLTTIMQPTAQMAEQAVKVLGQRMNNEPTETEYILPVKLWSGTSA
ncbi:LacI family DNA-binding transcriptional regulator [Agrilactobacillus fermenti]|uniref:LacI family DNA-binding transcriptional regulator n=1 Tax=Agrilactobacillus fermenti TaxID=2586909 RepID=UPI001E4ED474|nr:LacI family DNA-binding transcriptional regulator [Agrilactobacillus fermenti]MCD2257321.1 LacI family DNA-binding transcriptional regulator [Agrilactobacillus fermenti]